MDKKIIFTAIGSLVIGGLIGYSLSIPKPASHEQNGMTMADMTRELENKSGDDFDAAFISGMIAHHKGAIDMAHLADKRAKHDEIKRLSTAIIAAQQQEIEEMERWRESWGYDKTSTMPGMDHSGH